MLLKKVSLETYICNEPPSATMARYCSPEASPSTWYSMASGRSYILPSWTDNLEWGMGSESGSIDGGVKLEMR